MTGPKTGSRSDFPASSRGTCLVSLIYLMRSEDSRIYEYPKGKARQYCGVKVRALLLPHKQVGQFLPGGPGAPPMHIGVGESPGLLSHC